jgi:hypothetical protein
MSGGVACACVERFKPMKDRRWVVLYRCCNYTMLSDWERVPSVCSSVSCQVCGRIWRTKAKYVRRLPDGERRREQED